MSDPVPTTVTLWAVQWVRRGRLIVRVVDSEEAVLILIHRRAKQGIDAEYWDLMDPGEQEDHS